jgi:hypothetical protein
MRPSTSKSKRDYVNDLAHALRHSESAVWDGSAHDSIGVFGVKRVVAKPLDQMLSEEGVEARNKVFGGHVRDLLLRQGPLLALCH